MRIFLLTIIFFLLSASNVYAARLYFLPQWQEGIVAGESFLVDVRLNTQGETVNVADVTIAFPARLFEVLDVVTGGSILELMPEEPLLDAQEGKVEISGGMPGGFQGDGLLAKLLVRGETAGSGTFSFHDSSFVLLHDGKATPASLSFEEGTYTVLPLSADLLRIAARFHENDTTWYRRDEVYFSWEKKQGASYSYVLSRDPLEKPDSVPDEPAGDIKYENIGEGIFYFSVREKQEGEETFGPSSRRRVMIDRTAPLPFEIQLAQIEDEWYAVFATTDALSGVARFEIAELANETQEPVWREAVTPAKLHDQKLRGHIVVRATDRAGNETSATFYPQEARGSYSNIVIFGILIGIGVISLLYFLFLRKRKQPYV